MAEGGREASGEDRQVKDGGMSNTVAVSGFSANTTQELLELYFENSRRSGGGDMEEVEIRDGVAYITFKEAEVAQRVVSHNHHHVDGQTLTATLFHPLPSKPCYQNRVLIQELKSAVTEELLRNFLETKTKAKVAEFLYGEEEGKVVVTFSNNIDIGQLRKTLQERSIEGAFLKVARVAISNCILVQNIQKSTSHDVILFYFDNKRRSSGGDVERVEMKADEGYCLVYFEDHTVIDRVVSQSHKVDGGDLEVHLHYECLGQRSSVNKSDPFLRISNPVNKDGVIGEVENTDNQSNDEDSSSVSSNPDKESDFVELQERQESEDEDSSSVSSNPEKESDFVEVQERQENNDEDSSSVSSNPEKESDFVEVQERQENKEDPFETLPVFGKEDIEIACYRDGTILFPSKDTHIEESNLIQTLVTEDFIWSNLYQSALAEKKIPFCIWRKGENEQGVRFHSTDTDEFTYRQKMKQLIHESDLKVHKVNYSLEGKHILSPFPSVIKAKLVTIYRNAKGDDLYFIGLKLKVNIALKEYGLVYLENHLFPFEASFDMSTSDCRALACFSECLKTDQKSIIFQPFPQEERLVCAASSVFEIETAIERIHSLLASVVEEELDISSYTRYLLQEKQTQIYIQEKLGRRKIACIVECSLENVKVTCASKQNLNEAKNLIKDCITETIIGSDKKTELKKLMDLNKGKMKIFDEMEKDNLIIVCTHDVTDAVLSIISDSDKLFISLLPSERFFLSKHRAEELHNIENEYNTEITFLGEGVILHSNSGLNTKEVEEAIRKLLPRSTKFICVDQEANDFVSSEEGKSCIAQLADDNKAICTLQNAEDTEEDACDNVLCRWYCGTKGHQILLVQGRAADLHVDCLVIPVNGSIIPLTAEEHGIEESADDAVKQEVSDHLLDKGRHLEYSEWWIGKYRGTLKCGAKLYLPVESYTGFIGQNNLREQLINIFVKATELLYESIGLPLELFDSQKRQSYEGSLLTAAVEATIMCLSKEENSLSSVYLCTCEKQTIDTRIQKIERICQEKTNSRFICYLKKVLKPKFKSIKDDIQIKVMYGSLDQAKTDVLVNSVAKCLDLNSGDVSRQLAKSAGPGLQEELNKMYKDGITWPEIAISEPHNLKSSGCKRLLHVAVDGLEMNIKEKIFMLKVLTLKCLEKADEMGMSSIAFPALGSGRLWYPYRDVAWAMFEAVNEFQPVGENQHLKKVTFVIYEKDAETMQAFLLEESRRNKERHSGTKPKIGKVPKILKGRLNYGMRPEFDVKIAGSNYPVPSYFVKVIFQINTGTKGIYSRHSFHKADCKKEEWNDWYLIETSDDKKMFKKGIQSCVTDAATKRVTHLLVFTCKDSHMTASVQIQCITDIILRSESRYLQIVSIGVSSEAEMENIKSGINRDLNAMGQVLKNFMMVMMTGLSTRSISWTFSNLPAKRPAQLMIQLLSDTQDHIQNAEKAIVKKLDSLGKAKEPLEIDSKLELPAKDSLVERAHRKGQSELFTNFKEARGGDVSFKGNQAYLVGETAQMEITKHHSEELCEERLNSKETKLSKGLLSNSLEEESFSSSVVLNNVSEVEFKALKIIENGFEKINATLSWDDGAIKVYGPSACTVSVIKELSSQLMVLRFKQVEISLDEEEKKVVKHIIEEIEETESKDTIWILDEKNNQVVVYTDKQDDIVKFKHKLKLKTGRVKESGRSRKRFVENTHCLESSRYELSSSVRSTEFGKEFSCSNESSDVAEFYTKENIKVSVYKADILNLPVDCIVNAANDRLQHGGGVAKVIADAAGPELVQEGDAIIRNKGMVPVGCQVTTTAGRLPYRCVIHTVGPCWSDYQPHNLQKIKDCEESMYRAIYGCFLVAEKMGISTIAVPAVTSGIHSVPQDMCAVQYARAVIDYSRKSVPGRSLTEIHFIDKQPHLVKLMQDTFRNMIENGKVPNYNIENYVTSSSCQGQELKETGRKGHRKQDLAANKSQYETTKPKELSPVYYKSKEYPENHFVFQVSVKPVVHIYQGNILNLRNMDAVVCPEDLKGTGIGMIASELSKRLRYKKQKEKSFRMMKPDLGDVIITFGEENYIQAIVHVVIENNSHQKPEFKSVMKKSIDNILRKTNEWIKVKTIAMPLFGVDYGLLTEKSWAELFLERFVAFCHEVKNPNLEEVHIIVDFFSSSTCSTVKKVFIDFADKVNNASLPSPTV